MSDLACLVLGSNERATWLAQRLACEVSSVLPASFDGCLICCDEALPWADVLRVAGSGAVLDVSSTWFARVFAREAVAGGRDFVLADGVWLEFGVEQGFALCCGGASPEALLAVTPILDRLAPVAGAWLPLGNAFEASFAALLLNVLYHLALQGVIQMPVWQQVVIPVDEMSADDPIFARLKHVLAENFELAEHLRQVCDQFLALSPEDDRPFIAWVRWLSVALNQLHDARQHLQLARDGD